MSLAVNTGKGTRADFFKALLIVWMIIGILTSLVLIVPFIFLPDTLYSATPECIWKTVYGKPCPLCGMTHAFVLLSKGNIEDALIENSYSLKLYMVFILNTAALFLFLCAKAVRKAKQKVF